MRDEAAEERAERTESELSIVSIEQIDTIGTHTLRLSVLHGDGPVHGWAPLVFFSERAAEIWLADRSQAPVRPALRECAHGDSELAYAAVVDERGDELLVSEPLDRIKAAGVAAMLANALRLCARR